MLNTFTHIGFKNSYWLPHTKCSDGLRAWAFTAELVYNANHFLLVLLIWEVIIFWVVYNNSGSVMPQGSDEKGSCQYVESIHCSSWECLWWNSVLKMPILVPNIYHSKQCLSFFVVSLDVLFLLDAWKAFYLRLSLH